MRIALRACRAALEFFAPILRPKPTKRLARKLQRFGRKFGETRDWDVLCTQTIPTATASLPTPLDQIGERAARARAASHRTLEHILCSRSFTGLVLSLANTMSSLDEDPSDFPGTERPFIDVAAPLLDRILGKFVNRASHPRRLSANELHSLRKILDRLYDDITFVEGLYPRRRLDAYRERCQELQAILGASNDAVVTRRLIQQLDKQGSKRSRKACHNLVSWNKDRRKEALQDLEHAVDRFQSAAPFWR